MFEEIRAVTKNNHYVKLELKSGNGKVVTYQSFSDEELVVRKYCSIVQIVSILLQNIESGKFTTRRDIYYNNVELFRNQRFSNNLIDLILNNIGFAIGLQIDISAVNLYPNQKGLMFHTSLEEPVLIPISFSISSSIDFIVLIEKDAVFKSVTDHVKSYRLFPNILFITGKGFPDNLTKKVVKNTKKPVIAFMDSDIYGILIFLSYKTFGHATFDPNCVKQEFWFGGCFILDYTRGYLNISKRDVRIMINKIKEIQELDLKRELQRGLILHKKAEMDVVNKQCSGIVNYIITRINFLVSTHYLHENIARDMN